MKKQYLVICRVLLGLVFIFSGFVKAVDPWGTAYKFTDYFTAFHMNVPETVSLILSIILSAMEFVLGGLLLANVWLAKFVSRTVFVVMGIFTFMTLYIAIKNPVTDCGCFGDAIELSNWQSFAKNVILILISIYVFVEAPYHIPRKSEVKNSIIFSFTLLFILAVSLHSIYHLPILDFRPYRVGADLESKMVPPENSPADEYKTTFIYSKNGEDKVFDETNYPWNDSTWTFVSMDSRLIKKGYVPPIHDFILNVEGKGDIVPEILSNSNYSTILSVPKITNITNSQLLKISELIDELLAKGITPIFATPASKEEQRDISNFFGNRVIWALSDATALKTMVRSNGGVVFISEGVIMAKFGKNNYPRLKEYKSISQMIQSRAFTLQTRFIVLILGLLFMGGIFILNKYLK